MATKSPAGLLRSLFHRFFFCSFLATFRHSYSNAVLCSDTSKSPLHCFIKTNRLGTTSTECVAPTLNDCTRTLLDNVYMLQTPPSLFFHNSVTADPSTVSPMPNDARSTSPDTHKNFHYTHLVATYSLHPPPSPYDQTALYQ